MDLHYRREATVGALVLAGVAIFVAGTMWLSGRSLDTSRRPVRVAFSDVGNMKRGNPVKVSGVTLGSVERIDFEDVGRVLVTLSLDPRLTPKQDASASLASVGLVGDVVIDFDPGQAAQPLGDAVIVGSTAPGLLGLGQELGTQARDLMTGVQAIANKELADELRRTLVSIQRLADVYASTQQGPSAQLTEALGAMTSLGRRMDSTLSDPAIGRTLAQAETLTTRFTSLADQLVMTTARVDTLLVRINRGEGTLGRVATDTTLYTQLRDLSGSLKAFIDDLRRNPGKITVQVKLF